MNSIIHKTEAAFAAYLRSITDLSSCAIFEGLGADKITLPCVVCAASNPKELVQGCYVFEIELIIHLETQLDEETLDVHQARITLLQNVLDDVDSAKAFLNKPEAGNDSRIVKGYLLSGYYPTDIIASEQDRHAITELKYLVTACPEDST